MKHAIKSGTMPCVAMAMVGTVEFVMTRVSARPNAGPVFIRLMIVESLMVGVQKQGKMAGWVAPPSTGVHAKPVDFEYVKI